MRPKALDGQVTPEQLCVILYEDYFINNLFIFGKLEQEST